MWESYWRDRPQRFSEHFQWLPCEVDFTGEPTSTGNGVKITSYINNVHPFFHKSLYQTIEKLVSLSIAPWNDVLVWRGRGRTPPRIKTFGAVWWPSLPEWARDLESIEKEPESTRYQEARKLVQEYISQPGLPKPEHQGRVNLFPHVGTDWETRFGITKTVELNHKQLRHWLHPEPGLSYIYEDWKRAKVKQALVPALRIGVANKESYEFKQHDSYDIFLQEMFRDDGLQVVIEMRSIELTPDQPQV